MLVTVLSDEAVGSDAVVQEVGQTLTSVAEELGVNISVLSVQRLGRYSLYYYDYKCCNEFHCRSNYTANIRSNYSSRYMIFHPEGFVEMSYL